MSPEPIAPPELDAEQEVDLGHYWRMLVVRWWLPVAGLAVGVALGYLLSLGGHQVYRAQATLYLGQPFSPTGAAPVQSLNTNPSTVGQIIRSESALREAAARSGIGVGRLRGNVSTQTVAAAKVARAGQTPLVEISVKGRSRRKVALAANGLARIVIERVSGYVDVKIATFQRKLAGENGAIESIAVRIDALTDALKKAKALRLPPLDQLVLISQLDNSEQIRSQLVDAQSETQQLLSLAQNVERARVIEPAVGVKTTARSARNSALVGALIGLILGILATILWEPVASGFARRRAV